MSECDHISEVTGSGMEVSAFSLDPDGNVSCEKCGSTFVPLSKLDAVDKQVEIYAGMLKEKSCKLDEIAKVAEDGSLQGEPVERYRALRDVVSLAKYGRRIQWDEVDA